ncbi:cAMP-responsive element-binding protein-like 2 [Branchiostoma belcheri]|nr:cAMP-responsive element-binding protein-like 2 [Branchiostoma belcheri]
MKTEATSPEDTKDKTQKTADGKVKKQAKRGRKPSKIDMKAKLERSRQSARECRARKKLRYQYLEEMVANREKTIITRRQELDKLKKWCEEIDGGTSRRRPHRWPDRCRMSRMMMMIYCLLMSKGSSRRDERSTRYTGVSLHKRRMSSGLGIHVMFQI